MISSASLQGTSRRAQRARPLRVGKSAAVGSPASPQRRHSRGGRVAAGGDGGGGCGAGVAPTAAGGKGRIAPQG